MLHTYLRQISAKAYSACFAVLIMAAFSATTPRALAQFSSGSNGSDGAYAPTASGNFTPSQFHGTGVANNVFNFTTITIPAGVTITLTAGIDNAPVYWLATSKVDIEGTVNLAGAPGAPYTSDVDVRVPALAGSGGYNGGVGGNPTTGQNATPGSGPGGGATGDLGGHCNAYAGYFTGNQYLIPLVGGSGGGGANNGGGTAFGTGGGAGGGAILIASSTQIIVNGTITADGGWGGCNNASGPLGNGGSGGAVRLVSNTITGTGSMTAGGGFAGVTGSFNPDGGFGRIRLEAYTNSFTGSFNGTPVSQSTPLNLFSNFIPTKPQPSIRVTSVNGTAITENPFSFPDIAINTDQPVPVVITGQQVPVGTVPTLVILGETADQDLTCTGGLGGTLATSTCTINITFAFGGSRGLVKTTWQNPGSK